MVNMKLVYIAGPYRAKLQWDLEQNVRAAEAASLDVAKLGAAVYCPHTQSRHLYGTIDETYWTDAHLNVLGRCDAMLVLDGWQRSPGTLGEIRYAADNNIPCFYHIGDLQTWLESRYIKLPVKPTEKKRRL